MEGCKGFYNREKLEKGQKDESCEALRRLGKELQRAAGLWEEMFHRKLSKRSVLQTPS